MRAGRRRSWAVAAVAFLVLAVVAFVTTPLDPNEVDPVYDAVLFTTWLAGAGYGAFQIKPWLTARTARE